MGLRSWYRCRNESNGHVMVKSWYEKNKLFYQKIAFPEVMREVYEQASRHMERQDTNEIIKKMRPNEDEAAQKYRQSNKRDITHGDVDRWFMKMSRIIRDNVFSSFDGSDKLTEYQATKNYVVFGEGYDYFEWIIEYMLPRSVKDPNLIKVNLPFTPDEPLTPPKYGVVQTDGTVPFKELTIPYDAVFSRDQTLVFQYGKKVLKIGDNDVEKEVYWLADESWWYILEPFWSNSTFEYELIEWYQHDSGQLPFVNGLGVYKDGYKESLLRSYFELGDEFIGFFSDNQAIGTNHAFPKIVQIELPCPTCKTGSTSTGFETLTINGEKERIQCRTCHGSKLIQSSGPFATLSIPSDVAFSETPIKPADAIHPVVYGESQFQSRVDIGWDLLSRARNSVGLDLMVDVSESGIAKEYRLEDLQDIIGNVVKHIHQFMRNDLWLKECLLVPGNNRQVPVFDIPKTFYLEDEKFVLMAIRELPLTERQDKMIDYYDKKYKSDPVQAKIYESSVIYAPVQLYSDEEVLQYSSAGIFSKEQVVKGMYATWAMKQIGDRILTMKIPDIFAAADQIIAPLIDTVPVNVLT